MKKYNSLGLFFAPKEKIMIQPYSTGYRPVLFIHSCIQMTCHPHEYSCIDTDEVLLQV